MRQRLISLVVFAFVLGNGAGQVPVPQSETVERSLCNDFAWSLMHVRFASVWSDWSLSRCSCLRVRTPDMDGAAATLAPCTVEGYGSTALP